MERVINLSKVTEYWHTEQAFTTEEFGSKVHVPNYIHPTSPRRGGGSKSEKITSLVILCVLWTKGQPGPSAFHRPVRPPPNLKNQQKLNTMTMSETSMRYTEPEEGTIEQKKWGIWKTGRYRSQNETTTTTKWHRMKNRMINRKMTQNETTKWHRMEKKSYLGPGN